MRVLRDNRTREEKKTSPVADPTSLPGCSPHDDIHLSPRSPLEIHHSDRDQTRRICSAQPPSTPMAPSLIETKRGHAHGTPSADTCTVSASRTHLSDTLALAAEVDAPLRAEHATRLVCACIAVTQQRPPEPSLPPEPADSRETHSLHPPASNHTSLTRPSSLSLARCHSRHTVCVHLLATQPSHQRPYLNTNKL